MTAADPTHSDTLRRGVAAAAVWVFVLAFPLQLAVNLYLGLYGLYVSSTVSSVLSFAAFPGVVAMSVVAAAGLGWSWRAPLLGAVVALAPLLQLVHALVPLAPLDLFSSGAMPLIGVVGAVTYAIRHARRSAAFVAGVVTLGILIGSLLVGLAPSPSLAVPSIMLCTLVVLVWAVLASHHVLVSGRDAPTASA